jgi:hypothetical protein
LASSLFRPRRFAPANGGVFLSFVIFFHHSSCLPLITASPYLMDAKKVMESIWEKRGGKGEF